MEAFFFLTRKFLENIFFHCGNSMYPRFNVVVTLPLAVYTRFGVFGVNRLIFLGFEGFRGCLENFLGEFFESCYL